MVAIRPDIVYVVGVLCRFVENPEKDHWLAAKRVLCYLKGTVHTVSPDLFTSYVDADLSWNPDNSRSTGGFVSLSSTESEYTTLSKVGCEMIMDALSVRGARLRYLS